MLSQSMIVLDIVIGIIAVFLALGFLFVDINKNKRKEYRCMSRITTARELTSETIKEYDNLEGGQKGIILFFKRSFYSQTHSID